jgi:hypothetical protein
LSVSSSARARIRVFVWKPCSSVLGVPDEGGIDRVSLMENRSFSVKCMRVMTVDRALPVRSGRVMRGRGIQSGRAGSRCVAVISLLFACSGLMACSPADTPPAPSSQTARVMGSTSPPVPTSSTEPSAKPSTPSSGNATGETRVRIVIGDQTLHATLQDNPAARSLLDQLPLTLEFSDYGGQEATAKPPRPLTMTGMPAGDSPVAGDLGYYAPDGVITVHYADIGYWNGSARLGRIDGDLSVFKGREGPFTVMIGQAG